MAMRSRRSRSIARCWASSCPPARATYRSATSRGCSAGADSSVAWRWVSRSWRCAGTMSTVSSFKLPAFAELCGMELVQTDKQRVVGRIKLGPQHSNGGNRVHGGAIMTLADTLGAIGAVLNLPPDTVTMTLESKTNFLAAGRGPHLIGEATPVHVGRTTMVWQTVVRDGTDRRVAIVIQTQLVLPRQIEAEPA